MRFVAVLMGSESDWPVMQNCTGVLDRLGVQSEVRVSSADRADNRARIQAQNERLQAELEG